MLHDDAFTAAEFVVAMLVQHFAISPPIAEDLVRSIGKAGHTTLALAGSNERWP